MTLLEVAFVADGQPLLSNTPQRQWAETAGAMLYMGMQTYYTWRHTMTLRAMHHTLEDYYDRDAAGMLTWMQLSIVGLMLLALMVPFAIFATAPWLLFLIAMAIFFFLFYLVDSFCYYLTSNASARMQEAEANSTADEPEKHATQEVPEQTGKAIGQWIDKGGYRKAGITNPKVAAEIGIPHYQLTAWVKANGHESFSRWITALRLEEAKRVLLEYPDWSAESVADYCGFNSREYFHRIFKEHEGMTPTQYQKQHTAP